MKIELLDEPELEFGRRGRHIDIRFGIKAHGPVSVDEQDAAIRRVFPEFDLTVQADWIGVWEGPVKPASKTYRIRIVYFRRRLFDGWRLKNPYVTVYVVDPPVGGEAIKAMKQWQFKPGMKDGKPVPVSATIEVNFRLL